MQSSHGHRNLIGGLHYRRSVTVGNFCTNVQSPGHRHQTRIKRTLMKIQSSFYFLQEIISGLFVSLESDYITTSSIRFASNFIRSSTISHF